MIVERVELTNADRELIRIAIETSDRLYLGETQDVAAAVRTAGGEVFFGINFDARLK